MSDFARNAVACLSGGMDSTSLLLRLLADGLAVHGISFLYGQKHAIELDFLQRNLDYLQQRGHPINHQVVDLTSLGPLLDSALIDGERDVPLGHYEQDNMRETVVPNRNAIFASIAYAVAWSIAQGHAQPVRLCLGVHSGDHAIYPDCRPVFYQALWTAFERGNWDADKVELYLPYLDCDKAGILRDALRTTEGLGIDFDHVFANTLTSYLPDSTGRAHGLTGSDVERVLAFDAIGRVDPIEYTDGWVTTLGKAKALLREHQSGSKGPFLR
ncbi:MAG: 7-cyano-7-deazaguanine synthase [Pirellulaceae bacterium]